MPTESTNPTYSHDDLEQYIARGRQLRALAMRDALRAMVRRVSLIAPTFHASAGRKAS